MNDEEKLALLHAEKNAAEPAVQTEKTFTQAEVNRMISERLARQEKTNSSQPNEADINIMKRENAQLKKEAKMPAIKEAYLKNGGMDDKGQFNSFLQLNQNELYKVEDLETAIKVLSKENTWAFEDKAKKAASKRNDNVIDHFLMTSDGEDRYSKANGKAGFTEDIAKIKNK